MRQLRRASHSPEWVLQIGFVVLTWKWVRSCDTTKPAPLLALSGQVRASPSLAAPLPQPPMQGHVDFNLTPVVTEHTLLHSHTSQAVMIDELEKNERRKKTCELGSHTSSRQIAQLPVVCCGRTR